MVRICFGWSQIQGRTGFIGTEHYIIDTYSFLKLTMWYYGNFSTSHKKANFNAFNNMTSVWGKTLISATSYTFYTNIEVSWEGKYG